MCIGSEKVFIKFEQFLKNIQSDHIIYLLILTYNIYKHFQIIIALIISSKRIISYCKYLQITLSTFTMLNCSKTSRLKFLVWIQQHFLKKNHLLNNL